jgi:hypothetical protein
LESDLLRAGFTLADIPSRVTWRAVKVRYEHADQGDALYREAHGEIAAWSDTEYLLADLCDLAALLLWSKTADAQKGKGAPKPRPRPGVKPVVDGIALGSGGVPVDEFPQRWAEAVQRQLDAERAAAESSDETGEAVSTDGV